MRLFLCEKQSQARDLAAVIGGASEKATHITCAGDDVVTWASGHLLELPHPDEIDPKYKSWAPEHLPIIPARFQWKPKPGRAEEQLIAIGGLIKQAASVVLATDAEREGELIGRNILNHFRYSGPMTRLWLQALDPESVKEALGNLLPGDLKNPLFDAALTRAKSDWLVGMNASRAATLRLGRTGEPVPVGRVQTPTLALLVARDIEIANFVSQDYLDVTIKVKSSNGQSQVLGVQTVGSDNLLGEDDYKRILREAGPDRMLEVEDNAVVIPPPALPNLSHLQQRASLFWGWTAKHTLETAQRLYEHHKILSYPRSDSTVLPKKQIQQIPNILKNLERTALRGRLPSSPEVRETVFVDGLDTAHHAIVPTIIAPNMAELSGDETKLYLLVAKSFIASLYPDSKMRQITNRLECGGVVFSAQGEEAIVPGWKALTTVPLKPNPVFTFPQQVHVAEVNKTEKATSPPPHYTDGTLIDDMTHIRKFITNPKHLTVLHDKSSLGTEATRAGIIEGLVKSGLLVRDGTALVSSERARGFVKAVKGHAPLLVDPAETAIWEDGLQRIEKGTLEVKRFMEGIEKRVYSHTSKLLSMPRPEVNPSDVIVGKASQVMCPASGLAVRDTPRAWVFPGFPDVFCPKYMAKRRISAELYAQALSGEETPVLDGFTSKAGKSFPAALIFNKEANSIRFKFPESNELSGRSFGVQQGTARKGIQH